MWSIEQGVLKAPALLEEWGADLETEKKYQDFVLQADFRMPAKSDSGIFFRRLIPDMGNFGQSELFKIRSDNGMGLLLSFQFMPENVKKSLGLKAQDLPQIKPVHPAIKVWHTVKLTVIGTRLMAELDGDRILDFQYPKGYLAIEPASIRFQKHRFVEGANPGERNPCPIEYRNIFIKEMEPSESPEPGEPRKLNASLAKLLARIDAGELPEGYVPAKHQEYVDRRWSELSPGQSARVNQLWKEKQAVDPDMPNRGFSFVKILAYVADEEGRVEQPAPAANPEPQASAQDFQLDPPLAGTKDKLPSEPFHFVVETSWFHTLEKQAGLEVIDVELIPPSEDKLE